MEPQDIGLILKQFDQGVRKDYDIFVAALKKYNSPLGNDQLPDSSLSVCLRNLGKYVTKLTRRHADLVLEILRIDWTMKDNCVSDEFHHFACELVSAQTGPYLLDVMNAIVRGFRPKISDPLALNSEIVAQHNRGFQKLHKLLTSILRVAPSAEMRLADVVQRNYPNVQTTTSYGQEWFVTNLLKVTEYPLELVSGKLRSYALQTIVKHLIELDARAPREAIQKAEAEEELCASESDVFSVDCADIAFKTTDRPVALKEAQILDALMNRVLMYVHGKCYDGDGALDGAAAARLYLDLRTAFDVLLLPTHASCHAQFLLFYVCSFSRTFADDFLDFLWKKFDDPNVGATYRQTAVAYVASYLARAKYVGVNIVRTYLSTMKDWIHRYIVAAKTDAGSEPDASRHGPFYAVCQALFYVFVFRSGQLLDRERGRSFCRGLHLQKIVSSDLNPLRFCLPTVAAAFAATVRTGCVAVCDTILERNRRCFLPEIDAGASGDGVRRSHLDAFFPFDPYLLKKSSGFFEDIYQEYDCPAATTTTDVKSEADSGAQEEVRYYMEDDDDLFSSSGSGLESFVEMML